MSPEQKEEARVFREAFPSTDDIKTFFSPNNWSYALMHKEECATQPCITLMHVNAIYSTPGLVQWVVKSNIIGIRQLSFTDKPFGEDAANLAAEMFVSRNGASCTLYMMMSYFASYLSDYKDTKMAFDFQDILLQYNRKFLPAWSMYVNGVQKEKKDDTPAVDGMEGLRKYLLDRLKEGVNPRDTNLYKFGMINDAMLSKLGISD